MRARSAFSEPVASLFFNKMSSVFLAKILLLLVNIKGVEDWQKQGLQCNWVCDVTVKEAVGTHEQIGAKFKFNEQVDQNCTDDTTFNSWDFIEVGIILAPDVVNPNEFSFLTFVIKFLSEHVSSRQLLFGNQYEELESVNSNVSCVLRPKSNESRGVALNGLDALYSPLFYLRDNASKFQRIPFVGYVEMGGTFYFSAGFTNATKPEYRLQFDHWDLTRVRILSVMLLVVFTFFSPSLLTLFCPTVKTIQIGRLSLATKVEELKGNPSWEATHSPTEQEELIEADVDHSAANRDAGKELLAPRVATKQGGLKETLTDLSSWINDDLEHDMYSSTDAPVNSRLPNQEYNSSDGRSEMVGLRHAVKANPHRSTVAEFSQTHSGGTSGHRVSGSSSTMDESSVTVTIPPDKPQTGVQHQNIKDRNLDSVQVMDVEAPASPVGLRNVIANKVFSNSKSQRYQFVKFVILIMFPIFIPILIDVFVLAIPRSFSRIAANLPSPFLTKSVFIFTYKKYSGFMYACFVCYFFRIVFFCFIKSSSHWVPSFLCRKHLVCFICNHYLSQLVFPSKPWSACDECKEAPDLPKHCEIPVNIKHNDGWSLLEILKKDWKDVAKNFYPKYMQGFLLGSEEESSCPVVKSLVCLILGSLISLILFILLVILDTIASLPITSLCYGRVWFTVNWFKNRYTQAGCLIGEFFVTCFSIIGISYFLFCCSLSMVVALASFCIAGVNYPVDVLFYLAINIMVWHIFWSCYSSFTDIYDDLLLKLFNACSEDHESWLNQYKEGNVINIPQKLFTSACDKIKPIANSVKKLFFHLTVWVVGLFFLFSFIMGSSTDIPTSKVLAGTVTFLVVVHPSLWDFLLSRGKKKERKDAALKKKVKDHVDAFFKGKLD